MIVRLLALLGLLAGAAAQAAPAAPFAGADIDAGAKLHAKYCVSCHAKRFGGADGSEIYTRFEHNVTTPAQLAQQITTCTTMLDLKLFPEDELNLAGYLNQRYYKFK